jgi:DNA adenine methylase
MSQTEWGSLRAHIPPVTRPFLKWAGGKGQAFPSLRQYLPPLTEGQTYFEPFLGGGAVFFALQPKTAVLSDLNGPLIATFEAVKAAPSDLATAVRRIGEPQGEEHYYELRKRFNRLVARRERMSTEDRLNCAALFIWLNHTCYNGLHRVNQQGEFNVPFGFCQKPFIFSEPQLKAASRALREADALLLESDYEKVLTRAVRGDLAYLDPPYEPVSATASFTSYTREGFDGQEQERLSKVVHELVERGCRVVLSNSPSPRILELYKGFRTARVLVPRAINSVGSRRMKVDELVVVA